MGEGSVARGWQQVPSLGSIGQGERGDRAQYFVSADYSMALALAETLNDMARVVVLPQTPPELLRLRVETATRASAQHAGAAVVDAVNEVCPLISKPEVTLTREQRAVLMAQLRSYTGVIAELVHTGEEQETVIARSDSGTCKVALRLRTDGQISRWEAEVPGLLEGAAWKRRDDQAWENGEGVTLQLHSGSGLMSIEVEAGR